MPLWMWFLSTVPTVIVPPAVPNFMRAEPATDGCRLGSMLALALASEVLIQDR